MIGPHVLCHISGTHVLCLDVILQICALHEQYHGNRRVVQKGNVLARSSINQFGLLADLGASAASIEAFRERASRTAHCRHLAPCFDTAVAARIADIRRESET